MSDDFDIAVIILAVIFITGLVITFLTTLTVWDIWYLPFGEWTIALLVSISMITILGGIIPVVIAILIFLLW